MSNCPVLLQLPYGRDRQFKCEMDETRIAAFHRPPAAVTRVAEELEAALEQPLDFPPLSKAFVQGDRVVLAIDRATPHAATIVAAVWDVLQRQQIEPSDVAILEPPSTEAGGEADPRAELPEDVRTVIPWEVHDPTDEKACAYLATSTGGERIYLARPLIEADIVIPIGSVGYDPVLGFRGTSSVLYPGLSTAEAVSRSLGSGHSELDPDSVRPLRQLVDEITWLLGVQFTVQTIAAERGGASQFLAGISESVLRRGKELLAERWLVKLNQRAEVVIAAVDTDAGGHGWEHVGAALETARRLVARDGKIVLLSELSGDLGHGLQIVSAADSPADALKPLRDCSATDVLAATRLADAVDWANVYFLSGLDEETVEDLFMMPLANEREAQRVLEGDETCVFLGGAQHVYGQIVDA